MRAYVIKNDEKYFSGTDIWVKDIILSKIYTNIETAYYQARIFDNCEVVPVEIREITPTIKLSNCICGCKKIETWYSDDGKYYKCPKCGIKSFPAKTKNEMRKLWNNIIESMKGNK